MEQDLKPFVIIYTKENGREELTREQWHSHFYSLTYHREDGPAVIRDTGDERWYLDGIPHRIDGPAVVYFKENIYDWKIEGKSLTKFEFDILIQEVKNTPLVLRLTDPRKWVREFKDDQ